MTYRIRQLTIDDILNNLVLPSEIEDFDYDMITRGKKMTLEVKLPSIDIREINCYLNGEYIYITMYYILKGKLTSLENGIYVGSIEEDINYYIENNTLKIEVIKKKKNKRSVHV